MTKMSSNAAARLAYDRHHIARAVYFTTCEFIGREAGGGSPYRRAEHPTLETARAAAGPRTMIYAVTPEGYSIHVDATNAP